MKRNIFCCRKGGATINGKFFPISVEDFLARQLERVNDKMGRRRRRRGY